jgi:hypothetical protein
MIDAGHIVKTKVGLRRFQISIVGKRRMEYRYVVQRATDNRSRYDYQNIFGSGIRHSGSKPVLERGGLTSVGTVVLTSRHESLRNERTTKLEKYLRLIVLRASREIQQGEEIFFCGASKSRASHINAQFFVLLRFET